MDTVAVLATSRDSDHKNASCSAAADGSTGGPAAVLFEALLDKASRRSLYGEVMEPATGVQLGNFPQALTHAARRGWEKVK